MKGKEEEEKNSSSHYFAHQVPFFLRLSEKSDFLW